MFLEFAFVVSLKFLNTLLPDESFQNLNRCGVCMWQMQKKQKKLLFHKAAFMLDKQNWTIMLENGLVLGGLHIKHYMGHEVAVTTTKHFTNRPWYLGLYLPSFSLLISKWVRCISGDKPASFCVLSHKTSAQMGKKTRSTQKTLKTLAEGENNCGEGLSTVKWEDATHKNLIPSSEHLEWQKCLEYFYFSHCSSFPRFMTQERFTISQRGNCVTPDSH